MLIKECIYHMVFLISCATRNVMLLPHVLHVMLCCCLMCYTEGLLHVSRVITDI